MTPTSFNQASQQAKKWNLRFCELDSNLSFNTYNLNCLRLSKKEEAAGTTPPPHTSKRPKAGELQRLLAGQIRGLRSACDQPDHPPSEAEASNWPVKGQPSSGGSLLS